MAMVRGNGWKLVLSGAGSVQLYDLSADPQEQHDLAAARHDQVARLRQSLAEWRESCTPYRPEGPDSYTGHRLTEEQMQRLRDLGYVR